MRITMNQEPLGVAVEVAMPSNLKRWSDTIPQCSTDYSVFGEAPRHAVSPFPFKSELNYKIMLW